MQVHKLRRSKHVVINNSLANTLLVHLYGDGTVQVSILGVFTVGFCKPVNP